MIIRSVYTLSLPLILMVGCAATVPVVDAVMKQTRVEAPSVPAQDSEIHKIIRTPISVTKCRRTQRDLRLDWISREYLCSHDRRLSALQGHNEVVFHGHPRRYKPLMGGETATGKGISKPAGDMISFPTEGDVKGCDPLTPALSLGEREPVQQQPVRIFFARNHEVLGPKGTEKSLSLIPAVKVARRVTLRGVYENTEIVNPTLLNHERFSVGRALSIRKLWKEAGVDPVKVTILHHRTDLSGRYVEVIFHDQ